MKNRALKPDAQAFDEIRFITIPRFKTSELSGNEWRISVSMQFFRKSRMIHEEVVANEMDSAMSFAAYKYAVTCDNGHAMYVGEENFCDQEGCAEQATVVYRLKRKYCDEPNSHKPTEYAEGESPLRHFCGKHSKRGDSSFDDSDDNYELNERLQKK